jgi:hypothetical protein
MAAWDSLSSLLDYECYWTTLLRDWLGSDLRVGHFRCPLVNTPQLNTQLPYDWTMTDGSHPNELWTNSFITSGRTEYVTMSYSSSVTLFFIRCSGNVC